jgi:hypothetical protein
MCPHSLQRQASMLIVSSMIEVPYHNSLVRARFILTGLSYSCDILTRLDGCSSNKRGYDMPTDTRISHFDALEAILDQTDIKQVVLMLARICNEKADHVRSNWQDENLAKTWEFNSRRLATVEEKLRRTF